MSAALLAVAVMVAAPVPIRLPAEVDDAYALRFNPAGLGRVPGPELRLLVGTEGLRVPGTIGDDGEGSPRSIRPDYGLGAYAALPFFGRSSFGIGFEADEEDGDFQRALSVGFGSGMGPVSFGFSFTNLWPFDGDDRGFWSLGAQIRPWRAVGLGFSVRDVGQSVFNRQYDTGLAFRFFPRITISGRWRYEEGEKLNDDTLDLSARLAIEPLDGVHIGGFASTEGRYIVQLSLDLERFSVGGQLDFDDDDVFFTTEMVFRGHRKPSLLPVRRVAVITLAGDLKPDPTFLLFQGGFRSPPYGGVPLYLERLRNDDELVGVLAQIGPLSVGWATAQEVRSALLALRESGRRVDWQLTGEGDKSYFVASACTSIIIPPPLQLEVNGVQAKLLFVGEALDRYGVEVEVHRRSEYKTAPETFTRAGLSAAQRTALSAYLDQVQSALVDGIAEGRGRPAGDVEGWLARGIVTSSEAADLKMVDRVMYPDEVEDWVRQQYDGWVFLARGAEALQPDRSRWGVPPAIAIVHIDDTITSGPSRNLPLGLGRGVGAETVVQALERARRSRSIAAVVLRVDSPGGGAYASDVIARAVRRLAATKPVIASFGDVAASGGYYVASGARAIYAQPTTLTGSIGVFALRFSAETLLRRLGVNAERLGPGIGSPSPYLRSTPREREIAEKGVEATYRQFLRAVAEGRGKDVTAIEAVAGGRVWTGTDAKARGLVDELGGLVAALKRARVEAGLDPDARVRLLNSPDDVQPLPLATRIARSVGLTPEGPPPVELWPRDFKGLIGPLLATDPRRPGTPPPLAWLPLGLSVD